MNVTKRKRNVLIATALIFSIIGVGSVYEAAQGSSTKALVSQVKVASTSIAPTASDKVVPIAPVTPVVPANPQATLKVVVPTKVAVVPVKTAVVPVAKTVSPLVKTVAKVATKVFTKGTVKTFVSVKPTKVTVSKGSIVTTKTASGSQTLTVNTSKVTVTVTPTVTGNPTDTQASASPQDVYTPPALPVSDWTGFVAPKVSFVKMLSCVKSAKMEYGITGVLAYKFTIINQLKLTGGHYNYDGHIYSSSDVLYITHGPYTESTNSMDLSMGLGNPTELQFLAFNWKDHGGGPTAGGVSDAGYQNFPVSYLFHSTQAECDNLPKP